MFLDTPQGFGGMRVVIDDTLTEFDLVRRTWRERLLTRPWRPWQAYRQVPKPPRFFVSGRTIYTTQRGYNALNNATKGQS